MALVEDDHLEGCDLDFTVQQTTAEELESLLVPEGAEEDEDE